MSLKTDFESTLAAAENALQTAFSMGGSLIGGGLTQAGVALSNIWDGGFIGVSDFEALKTAISKYVEDAQKIVDEYNEKADLENTFKGKAGEAMSEFIVVTKKLLQAWVAALSLWKEELDAYMAEYQAGDQEIASDVAANTESVEKAASEISLN